MTGDALNPEVYQRIDQALKDGRRNELIIIGLSVMIFLLGVACIIVALAQGSAALAAPALLIELLLYWPIRQILRIRKENIALATAPALINTLPPAQAAAEMVKFLENVRGE